MATTVSPEFLSDELRNSKKYEALLIAFRHANEELHSITSANRNLDSILAKLAPDFMSALEGTSYFLLSQRRKIEYDHIDFEILSAYKLSTQTNTIQSEFFKQILEAGKSRSINDTSRDTYKDLEALGIKNAVLIPLKMLKRNFIIGVGNKQNLENYPFLAGDRIVLEYFVTSIATGLRTEERLDYEQNVIQAINESVSKGNTGQLLRQIVQAAALLSDSKYAAICSWAASQNQLVIQDAWNAQAEREITTFQQFRLREHGLNMHVATSASSKYIADTQNTSFNFYREKFEKDVRSAYCVPLISQKKVVGTLYVASTQLDGVSDEERHVLNRLANHAAVAFHNASLFSQSQNAQQLATDVIQLHEAIADVLQRHNQVEQIQQVLLEKHFSANHNLFIATYNEVEREIRLPIIFQDAQIIANPDKHHVFRPRKVGFKHGLIEYMLARRLPVLQIADFDQWPDKHRIGYEFRANLRCVLVVELKHEGKIVGWVGFRGFDEPNMFTERQVELLRKAAPHIAIILHNSHQYELKVGELEAVSRFQTKISDLNETEAGEVSQISAEIEDALQTLGLDTSYLYMALYHEKTKTVRTAVANFEGEQLTKEEIESNVTYQTRHLNERQGFTEWIIRTGRPILCHNQEAIRAKASDNIKITPYTFLSWFGVPMKVAGKTIGVLAIRSQQKENLVSAAYVELLQTIANQAAITIENARKYQELNERSKQNTVLFHASREIARAGLTRDDILNTLIELATKQTGSHLGVLYLEEQDLLEKVVFYSEETADEFPKTIGLDTDGITTLTFKTAKAQLVTDIAKNQMYQDWSGGKTSSQLSVALRDDSNPRRAIGVLSLEHARQSGLNKNDRKFLIALANLATVAIKDAEQVKDINRNKLVALMSTWGAEIVHDVNRETARIREKLFSLPLEFNLSAEVQSELEQIDKIAGDMQLPELPVQSPDSFNKAISQDRSDLDEVIATELETFKKQIQWHLLPTNEPRLTIDFKQKCGGLQVGMHHLWIRRILQHFLVNAHRHLSLVARPSIVVTTETHPTHIYVCVENNGPAIPEEIQRKLFDVPIKHANQVSGRGLILVRFICEAHRGKAWLEQSNEREGTCFKFSIPIVDSQN